MPIPVAIDLFAVRGDDPSYLGTTGGGLPMPGLPADGQWLARPAGLSRSGAAISGAALAGVVAWARTHRAPRLELCEQSSPICSQYLATADLAAIADLPFLQHLRLSLFGDDLAPEAIDLLGEMPALARLEVASGYLPAPTVKRLRRYPRLGRLEIGVADADAVAMLKALPDLSAVTLTAHSTLSGLPGAWPLRTCLESLTLTRIALTGDNLDRLSRLPRFASLRMSGGGIARLPRDLPFLRDLKVDGANARLIGACPELRTVSLRAIDAVTAKALARLPHLEALTLVCARIDAGTLAALTGCPSLRSLELQLCALDRDARLDPLRTLLRLEHLAFPQDGTDADLKVVMGLPALTSLDIADNRALTARGFAALGTGRLTSLRITSCRTFDDRGIPPIATNTGLRRLHLRRIGSITDRSVALLSACRDLEELDLYDCGASEASLASLAKLPRLRRRTPPRAPSDTSYFDGLGKAGVAALTRLPILGKLFLTANKPVAGLAAALARCQGLREATLAGEGIGDAEITAIAGLPGLAVLELTGTRLGDDGLSALGVSQSLRQLWIRVAATVGDRGLAGVGGCASLRDFRIEGAKGIRGRGLTEWPAGHGLRRLEIAGSPQCGDDLLPGLGRLTRLESLTLKGAPISDRLWQAVKGIPHRLTVMVYGCSRLSYALAQQLRDAGNSGNATLSVYHDIAKSVPPARVVSRVAEKKLRTSTHFTAKRAGHLNPAVIAQLTRLGAKPGGKSPAWATNLPAAIRELLGWRWPKGVTYGNDEDCEAWMTWAGNFSLTGSPDSLQDMHCLEGRAFFSFGMADGGNDQMCIPCDTDMSEDPPVYLIDHEWYHSADAENLSPIPLSRYLASLHIEAADE